MTGWNNLYVVYAIDGVKRTTDNPGEMTMDGDFVEGYIQGDYVAHCFYINGVLLKPYTRLAIREWDRWIQTTLLLRNSTYKNASVTIDQYYLQGTGYYGQYLDNLYAKAFIPRNK